MINNTEFKLYQLADKIVYAGWFAGNMIGCPHGRNMEQQLRDGVEVSEKYLPGRMIMSSKFTDAERELMKKLKQKHFNGIMK